MHLAHHTNLFKRFIFIFILTMFIPIIVISSISYFRSSQELTEQAKDYIRQIIVNINDQVDQSMYQYENLTLQIISTKEVRAFTDLQSMDYFGLYMFKNWIDKSILKDILLLNPFVENFSIINDNNMLYNSGQKNIDVYNNHLRNQLPTDGKTKFFTTILPFKSSDSDDSKSVLVTLGRRIYSGTSYTTKGSFLLNIRATELKTIWDKTDLKGGYIWILDDTNQIIYHPDNNLLGSKLDLSNYPEFIDQQEGAFKKNQNGEPYYFVFHTSDHTKWKMIATVPMSYLQKPISRIGTSIIYYAFICFFLTIAIGYFFILSITNPINKLKNKMIDVGNGNFSIITGNLPKHEVGDLMIGFNNMAQKIQELIQQVRVAEINQQKEKIDRQRSELEALQMQINPHFLYNTLGAINAYALLNESKIIQSIIDALSNMFRYAVQNPLKPVKVKDEINHVKNYLTIYQYRQPSMPQIYWDVDNYVNYPMLRLTLQPLIENVFHHAFPDGVQPHHKIWIEMKKDASNFYITVRDNGIGYIPEVKGNNKHNKKARKGIGLSNVHRRLQLFYGIEYGLTIIGKHNEGTSVVMKIALPIENTEDIMLD